MQTRERPFESLYRWVLIGIIFDLVVSALLVVGGLYLNANQTRANCWDHVLALAVKAHTPRSTLIAIAQNCVKRYGDP